MTTTIRKTKGHPSFSKVDDSKILQRIEREIIKIHPKCEVTVEGHSEINKGTITEWYPQRKFFSVTWNKLSPKFSERINEEANLRVFLKVRLFTTQIIFKTVALRRVNEDCFHFRIPSEIFQHQLRAALRVPLRSSNPLQIATSLGQFKILDLSVGGAKVSLPSQNRKIPKPQTTLIKSYFTHPSLKDFQFNIKVTNVQADSDPPTSGFRFLDLPKEAQSLLKQILIEELQAFYKKLK